MQQYSKKNKTKLEYTYCTEQERGWDLPQVIIADLQVETSGWGLLLQQKPA